MIRLLEDPTDGAEIRKQYSDHPPETRWLWFRVLKQVPDLNPFDLQVVVLMKYNIFTSAH